MEILLKDTMGNFEKYTKEKINNIILAGKKYTGLVKKYDLLSGKALRNDDRNLTNHKKQVSEIIIAFDEFHDAVLEGLDNNKWEKEIDKFGYPDIIKEFMLKSIMDSINGEQKSMIEQCDAIKGEWINMQNAINYMAENESNWIVRDDDVIEFKTDLIHNTFRKFLSISD